MEALAAIGLVSNILSFIDYANQIVLLAREISVSASSSTKSNVENTKAANRLKELSDKLQHSQADPKLQSICDECFAIANEMLDLSSSLRATKGSKLSATKVAIKSLWKKGEIESLEKRLMNARQQVILHCSIDMSTQLGELAAKLQTQEGLLQSFDQATRDSIATVMRTMSANQAATSADSDALLNALASLGVDVEQDLDGLKATHLQSTTAIREDIRQVAIDVESHAIETQSMVYAGNDEMRRFFQTQIQELQQSVSRLALEMEIKNIELKEHILLLAAARDTERESLAKKGNAMVASIAGLSSLYDRLKVREIHLKTHSGAADNEQELLSKAIREAKTLLTSGEIEEAVSAGEDGASAAGVALRVSSTLTEWGRMQKLSFEFGYMGAAIPFVKYKHGTRMISSSIQRRLLRIPLDNSEVPEWQIRIHSLFRGSQARLTRYFWLLASVPIMDVMTSPKDSQRIFTEAYVISQQVIAQGRASPWIASKSELDDFHFLDLPVIDDPRIPILLRHIAGMRWFAAKSGLADKIKSDFLEASDQIQEPFRDEVPNKTSWRNEEGSKLRAALTTILVGLLTVSPPWYVHAKQRRPIAAEIKFDFDDWPETQEGMNYIVVDSFTLNLRAFLDVMRWTLHLSFTGSAE